MKLCQIMYVLKNAATGLIKLAHSLLMEYTKTHI